MKPRVLLISRLFPPDVGGIQTYSYELAKGLTALGYEVLVLAPHAEEDTAFDPQCNFQIVRMRGAKLKWVKLFFYLFHTLYWSLKFKPQINLATIWAPCGLTAWIAHLLFKVPYLLIFHGTEIGIWKNRWPMGWIMKRSTEDATICTSNSQFTASYLQQSLRITRNVNVIPCGVDLERFVPKEALPQTLNTPPRLFTLAALTPRKGVDQVLEALALLKEENIIFHYDIAGSGPDLERLQNLSKARGLEDQVQFLGRVSDGEATTAMQHCDCFVMTSRQIAHDFEGFGIVFLEANACGKPVVAGHSGGIPDVVAHGKTGLLVPPENPKTIAQNLSHLLTHPEVHQQMQHDALQHAQQFSWNATAQAFHLLIQNTLKP